ncbi:hypothetical protein [Aquimarina algiphila]|uniref:hypothetical protein n=1 Tax=Aquimarina algiphila TaxID=2047982 RepID=UPI002490A0A6|nr:hypothetical protein [Aquimarina algiphila]
MASHNKEIYDAITSCDIDILIYRMKAFTVSKLGYHKSNYDGLEPLDFVFGVFEKALAGIRNWDGNKVDFQHFVFGVLQSEISAHFERRKRRNEKKDNEDIDESYIIDIPKIVEEVGEEDNSIQSIDNKVTKNTFLELLKNDGATDIEILIFECWCDDIYKPKEISELLDIDIKTIYNALKRLQKRRKKILQKKL